MSAREDILDEEFLRETPGLRPFSVGVFKLCRKMGLAVASKDSQPLDEDESGRQLLIIAWLLDERHSLSQILALPKLPREELDELITEYDFKLKPAFLLMVNEEIASVQRSMKHAAFAVEPKPGSSQGPSPTGNS